MNRNTHSERHVGGTRPPSTWERRCSLTRISGWHALQVVPQRAPWHMQDAFRSAESCGSRVALMDRGTKGHDGPQESVRVQGRAS